MGSRHNDQIYKTKTKFEYIFCFRVWFCPFFVHFMLFYAPFVSAGAGDLSFICLYLFIRLLSKPNPYFVKERNNKLHSRLLVFMFPAMLNYV